MTRILIAGAGAVGQWLAARLTQAGADVTALVRERFVEPLQNLSIRGETTFDGAIKTTTTGHGSYDLIIITAKAYQTAAIAEQVAPFLAAGGVLASLQNGLGNAQKILRFVPAKQVALAATSNGLTLQAPGKILHAGLGPTRVGPAYIVDEEPLAPDAGQRLLEVLELAGLAPEWCPDMRGALWAKAIVNNGINPVAGAAGVTNGAVADDPDLHARCLTLVGEGVSLSRAAGVALPPGSLIDAALATLRATAGNRCSMLQDIEARRPTEIEQITGRLVRLSRRLGYPMEVSEEAYREIKAVESAYLGEPEALLLARTEAEWSDESF